MSELNFLMNYSEKNRDSYEKDYKRYRARLTRSKRYGTDKEKRAQHLDDRNQRHYKVLKETDIMTTKQQALITKLNAQIEDTQIVYRHERNRRLLLLVFLGLLLLCFIFVFLTV